jgi:hypothetical protein
MNKITMIGLDLAKSVFQVHGVDAEGNTVLKKRLTRAPMAEFFCPTGTLCGGDGSLRECPLRLFMPNPPKR